MATFEGFRKHWFWGLIAFIITTLIAVGGLFLQYRSTKRDTGGVVNATFHSRIINNKDARTIVVCMEDSTIDLTDLYVTPTFDNQNEFSLKDFSLSFDATCTNVIPIPTTFVDAHEYGKNEWIFKYRDNILAAYDDTKKPFAGFKVKDERGRCYIKTKASHDGAASAFEYESDVWFLVVPNTKHLSFEDWKTNCKKRLFEVVDEKFYDVYYFSNIHEPEFQFDVALGSSEKKAEDKKSLAANTTPVRENKIHSTAKEDKKYYQLKTPDKVESEEANNREETSVIEERENNREIPVKDFEIKDNTSDYKITINLEEEIDPSDNYLLVYEKKDTSGVKDFRYHLMDRENWKNNKQAIIYYSHKLDVSNIIFTKILREVNADNYIITTKNDSNTLIENKNENEIVLVIIYSNLRSSYVTLGSHATLRLDDTNYEALKVFDTGIKTERSIKSNDMPDDLMGWLILMSIVIIFLLAIFGVLLLTFFVVKWYDDGYSEAKKEWDGMSYSSILESKESTGTKLWFMFITTVVYLTPITLILSLFIIIN
jgi:hypothetical protein